MTANKSSKACPELAPYRSGTGLAEGFKVISFLRKFARIFSLSRKEFFLLLIILTFSAFFRLYRLDQLLGFWYDQGRDALVIWDLLHYGKFFLIGPVTGVEGIFLGPFYYYLLALFYWLGRGSPAMPAAAIGWMNVGAVFLIYLLGRRIFSKEVGLLAAFLYGFSYNNVTFSRWLANPAPLPFFVMLTLYFLWNFMEKGKNLSLVFAGLLIGLCLQLEAASAVFFLPATLIILIWQRKKLSLKLLILSFLAFFITLLPQLVFNFRHEGVLFNAFKKFLIADKSFNLSLIQTFRLRLLTYYDVFCGKLVTKDGWPKLVVLALFSAPLIFLRKKVLNKGGKMLILWLSMPIIGFLFYRGNRGYVWDYYFTGVLPAFIILFSAGLWSIWRHNFVGKSVVIAFLFYFFFNNIVSLKNYLKTGIGITLRAQKRAIGWIYQDVGKESFNADFYVPPQIYYSYSYLMKWYGKDKFGREPDTKLVKNLYTLYEPDGEHPQFLKAWLKRQDTIGKIVKDSYNWGDITVQRRERIKYE